MSPLPRRSGYATAIVIVIGCLIGLFALATLVVLPATMAGPPDENFRVLQVIAIAAVTVFGLLAGVFFTYTTGSTAPRR